MGAVAVRSIHALVAPRAAASASLL